MNRSIRFTVFVAILSLIVAVVMINAEEAQTKKLNFDHSLHIVDMEMECSTCHLDIGNAAPGQRSIPDHDVCSECHDTDDECGICHVNPDEPEASTGLPGLYEGFGHKFHNSVECATCHGDVSEDMAHFDYPEMSSCQSCHMSDDAPLDCGVCHNGMSPQPEDHEMSSWKGMDHGLEASHGTTDCMACHEQITCDSCHQGTTVFATPHEPNWIANHFAESAFGGECMVCHETRDECVTCHKAVLGTPHELGPAWANNVDGGEHKEEAEMFMEACISCHDVGNADLTCITCHDE